MAPVKNLNVRLECALRVANNSHMVKCVGADGRRKLLIGQVLSYADLVDCIQYLMSALDLVHDGLGLGGPDERPGRLVMLGEVAADGCL